jgi:ABC-type multidrug transport system ATPase subunit
MIEIIQLLPNRDYTIGRENRNHIVINQPQISRSHAIISVDEKGRPMLRDLGSKYGTFLNEKQIEGQILIHEGDKICFGVQEFFSRFNENELILESEQNEPVSTFIREYPLHVKRPLTIGRATTCDIVLDAQQVSRFHSRVEFIKDRYYIMDLGSMNGTFINGRKEQRRSLKERDIIQIGPIRFLFSSENLFQLNQKDIVRIDLFNVSKSIGDLDLIRDVSFSIYPKEFVGILGPSGSGKSTLINVMAGIMRATSGDMYLNGAHLQKNYRAFKSVLGLVPQEDIIHPELTVYKALQYAAELRLPEDMPSKDKGEIVTRVIEILELEERRNTQISSLSGGQKKRVNLGVELITEPGLLFLDEPTAGLDPGLEVKMMELFRRLADGGQTLILSTHSMGCLDMLDLVMVIYEGRIIFVGKPTEIRKYFNLERYDELFTVLERHSIDEWNKIFRASRQHQEYVLDRLRISRQELQYDVKQQPDEPKIHDFVFSENRTNFFTQFKVLAKRYFDIIRMDRNRMAILIGQAPLVALLLVLVFKETADHWPLLFCLAISSIWFGCINSITEITKEKHIYHRERTLNLMIVPYIFSKLGVLFVLCTVQCAILVGGVRSFITLDGNLLWIFVVVLFAAWGGLTLGLSVSTMVSTNEKALAILPLILIPQILFSGSVVTLDNMINLSQFISNFMLSRWAYGLLKKISTWGADTQLNPDFTYLFLFIPIFIFITMVFLKRKDFKR